MGCPLGEGIRHFIAMDAYMGANPLGFVREWGSEVGEHIGPKGGMLAWRVSVCTVEMLLVT